MKQVLAHKNVKDYSQTCAVIDRLTADVNHVVRVNGSSAFPMPTPKKKTGVVGRIVEKFKR